MKRFFLLLLLACVAVNSRAAEQPNVIIILADDLAYGDIGCYGAKGIATPNLDRLAAEGTRFSNFHVAQPVCSASRAALLTGCYPNRLGIHGALGPAAKHGLAHDEVTIAELLKARGYATGMAGKWHLGRPKAFLPLRHGFDEYLGIPYSNDMWPRHPEAKAGTYPPLPMIEGDEVVDSDVTPDDQRAITRQFTERAVSFIGKHRAQPFFFYLAHPMPHVPLYTSPAFTGKSQRGLYGDVIMEIDWSVGQILAALKKHQLETNTIVIFTSDNGPWLSYGNHAGDTAGFREGKGTIWEGGTRVPFLARWPGRIPAGVNSNMVVNIDVLPTLAAVVGAPLPERKIDGHDLSEIVAGKPEARNPHEAYAWYYHRNELHGITSGDGRWKLVLPHNYRTLPEGGGKDGMPSKYVNVSVTQNELYDLHADPFETTNVAEKHPEIVKRLLQFAEQMRKDLGDSLTARQGSGLREAKAL